MWLIVIGTHYVYHDKMFIVANGCGSEQHIGYLMLHQNISFNCNNYSGQFKSSYISLWILESMWVSYLNPCATWKEPIWCFRILLRCILKDNACVISAHQKFVYALIRISKIFHYKLYHSEVRDCWTRGVWR